MYAAGATVLPNGQQTAFGFLLPSRTYRLYGIACFRSPNSSQTAILVNGPSGLCFPIVFAFAQLENCLHNPIGLAPL